MQAVKVLEVLEATVGGARKHVFQLLRGLDRARFDVDLACSFERAAGIAREVEGLRSEGVRVAEVPMRRRPSPVSDLAALRALERLMATEDYALVHTHASKAGFLGRLAARRAGVAAVLHTPHTFPFERRDTCLTALYRWLERRAARWADRIVLVAESQREVARAGGVGRREQLAVVENGIAAPQADPAELRRRYRAVLGIPQEAAAVGFVGRLAPQKDIQTLLSIADELFRAVPGVQVFVVGGGGDHRYLRSLRPPMSEAAWRVAALGEAPGEPVVWSPELPVRVLGSRGDAAELVAAFDAVLLPSLYEGLPYSLLEAMALGVPVVASRVTGNRDAIEDGKSGCLAPVGDVAEFARAAVSLLTDPERRRAMGSAARARVAAEFTEERFLARMATLYDEVLAEKLGRDAG